MPFGILKETGRVDTAKTRKIEKQLQKSCDKITKTIFEEVTKFQKLTEGEKTSSHFWGSIAHRAFLYMSQTQKDVYVSAEIADIFASKDLNDPENVISGVDIERLESARIKEKEKQAKKRARRSQ